MARAAHGVQVTPEERLGAFLAVDRNVPVVSLDEFSALVTAKAYFASVNPWMPRDPERLVHVQRLAEEGYLAIERDGFRLTGAGLEAISRIVRAIKRGWTLPRNR